MDNSEQDNTLFSMEKESIESLVEESKEQLTLAQDYLSHFLGQELVNRKLISLLCDYLTCNYLLLTEADLCLQYNEIIVREKKNEIVLSSETIELLQSTALGRWFTTRELAKLGVSIAMN